jgi:hypothetical protein
MERHIEAKMPYSYEITKVELIISGSSASNALNNSTIVSVTKLLKDVEKSYKKGEKLLNVSKVVDENGE